MNSTRILFVRHTDVLNPAEVFYGRLPRFGLSAVGREQAERTARYLAPLPISAIYASPLLRARKTALVISRYHPGVPVSLSRLLLEVMSSWQGAPFSRLTREVNLYEPRTAPDDETIADVFARMQTLLLRLVKTRAREAVVCVTHADPIMILRVGMAGQDLTLLNIRGKDYPSKGSVSEFRFAPGSLRPEITYVDVAALHPDAVIGSGG